jgi:DNA-binding transcriptional MerR regulator
VSSRTYLSIGDVLTLLREEFPDVTISKIRFLESQGLVNPERSPSGYRKFFEHDVERLRWVLRQQREHFLPLKVIRDRLADGDLDDEAPDANGKQAEPVHAQAGPQSNHVGSAGTPAGGVAARAPRADEQPTKADEEAMARILADASRRAANLPEGASARRALQVVGEEPPATKTPERAPAAVGAPPARAAGTTAAAATAAPPAPRHAADAAPPPPPAPPAQPPPPARPAAGPAPAEPPAPTGGGRSADAPASVRPRATGDAGAAAKDAVKAGAAAIVTGASLTGDELCSACGLSSEELAGLESFGIIEPTMVAGIATYDEDALTMGNLAAAFRAYGIEPRHLRPYRNAVDRELGLIEQVVIPLLRQRNPEARQKAIEAAEQLASLGQSMRATLLHQALRRHLGG